MSPSPTRLALRSLEPLKSPNLSSRTSTRASRRSEWVETTAHPQRKPCHLRPNSPPSEISGPPWSSLEHLGPKQASKPLIQRFWSPGPPVVRTQAWEPTAPHQKKPCHLSSTNLPRKTVASCACKSQTLLQEVRRQESSKLFPRSPGTSDLQTLASETTTVLHRKNLCHLGLREKNLGAIAHPQDSPESSHKSALAASSRQPRSRVRSASLPPRTRLPSGSTAPLTDHSARLSDLLLTSLATAPQWRSPDPRLRLAEPPLGSTTTPLSIWTAPQSQVMARPSKSPEPQIRASAQRDPQLSEKQPRWKEALPPQPRRKEKSLLRREETDPSPSQKPWMPSQPLLPKPSLPNLNLTPPQHPRISRPILMNKKSEQPLLSELSLTEGQPRSPQPPLQSLKTTTEFQQPEFQQPSQPPRQSLPPRPSLPPGQPLPPRWSPQQRQSLPPRRSLPPGQPLSPLRSPLPGQSPLPEPIQLPGQSLAPQQCQPPLGQLPLGQPMQVLWSGEPGHSLLLPPPRHAFLPAQLPPPGQPLLPGQSLPATQSLPPGQWLSAEQSLPPQAGPILDPPAPRSRWLTRLLRGLLRGRPPGQTSTSVAEAAAGTRRRRPSSARSTPLVMSRKKGPTAASSGFCGETAAPASLGATQSDATQCATSSPEPLEAASVSPRDPVPSARGRPRILSRRGANRCAKKPLRCESRSAQIRNAASSSTSNWRRRRWTTCVRTACCF
ncbi:Protein ALEX [Lemmus lemmus]